MGRKRRGYGRASEPRTLDDADITSFYSAADSRVGPMSRDDIIAELKRRNSHRWWRIQYDYRWVRKQMRKMGQNPDDARELL